jgi:uncharacterized protein YcbX
MTRFTVREIWRYPVKSMRGEMLKEAIVGSGGIQGDRVWVVRGPGGAGIPDRKNALARLLDCVARIDPASGEVDVTLPNGQVLRLNDGTRDEVCAALARLVAPQEITLWRTSPLSPEQAPSDFAPATLAASIRRVFGFSPADASFPDFGTYPTAALQSVMHSLTRYEKRQMAQDFLGFDFFPINLLSEASLRHLEATITHQPVDRRRFRPNFLVADDEGLGTPVEHEWEGRAVGLGEVQLFSVLRCIRCVMPSLGQSGVGANLARDPVFNPAVTRVMAVVGTYATVIGCGRVRVGDTVSISPKMT